MKNNFYITIFLLSFCLILTTKSAYYRVINDSNTIKKILRETDIEAALHHKKYYAHKSNSILLDPYEESLTITLWAKFDKERENVFPEYSFSLEKLSEEEIYDNSKGFIMLISTDIIDVFLTL